MFKVGIGKNYGSGSGTQKYLVRVDSNPVHWKKNIQEQWKFAEKNWKSSEQIKNVYRRYIEKCHNKLKALAFDRCR